MVKKIVRKASIIAFAVVILLGGATFSPNKSQATKKVSITKSVIVYEGKTAKIKLRNNKKKVAWSVKKGSRNISLSKKSKTGVTVKGKRTGTAKVQAKVGSKKYVCTVTITNRLSPYLSITRSFYSKKSESGMSSRCFFYDIKKKKLEQKGIVPYTSSNPLTLYSTRNNKIYYSAFSGKWKGNQIYLDNNGTGEKMTDQFANFNYLIQCGKKYFMAAKLLNHYCMEPIVCDAEFQNCSRVMFDKKDDRFTWMVSTVPKENKIVFSYYSDSEMRKADDEGRNAPSKIAMLDMKTKKTKTVYKTKYYIDGIACEGKKLILSCAPDGLTTRQKHKIYEVNLDTKKKVRLKLPFYIMDQMALYDNVLYFLGWKGDTRGIYAYNLTTKKYDVIMKEVEDEFINGFSLNY